MDFTDKGELFGVRAGCGFSSPVVTRLYIYELWNSLLVIMIILLYFVSLCPVIIEKTYTIYKLHVLSLL